jgi:hypothetical protein
VKYGFLVYTLFHILRDFRAGDKFPYQFNSSKDLLKQIPQLQPSEFHFDMNKEKNQAMAGD